MSGGRMQSAHPLAVVPPVYVEVAGRDAKVFWLLVERQPVLLGVLADLAGLSRWRVKISLWRLWRAGLVVSIGRSRGVDLVGYRPVVGSWDD